MMLGYFKELNYLPRSSQAHQTIVLLRDIYCDHIKKNFIDKIFVITDKCVYDEFESNVLRFTFPETKFYALVLLKHINTFNIYLNHTQFSIAFLRTEAHA